MEEKRQKKRKNVIVVRSSIILKTIQMSGQIDHALCAEVEDRHLVDNESALRAAQVEVEIAVRADIERDDNRRPTFTGCER